MSGERGARGKEQDFVVHRLGVGRKAESTAGNACLLALALASTTFAQSPFSFDDIRFWVGSGQNRAALAIDWGETSAMPPALVWGYRWEGIANGDDMLSAIVAADERLFAKLGGTRSNPDAVYGLGYDANGDGQFALDDGTVFDEQGFAFTSPADLAMATDEADYYAEGWFIGFWHYGVASANPFAGGRWSDTGVGMGSRELTDGAWDSWTFSPTFNFAAFADNPFAAAAPFSPGDFNRDGRVDGADHGLWRNQFGAMSDSAADGNRNGIVDAADYVVWRREFSTTQSNALSARAVNVPELTSALLFISGLFMTQLMFRRNTNRR